MQSNSSHTTPDRVDLRPLAFVYLSGSEVYVHEAIVRNAVVEDGNYGNDCIAECGEPMLEGMLLLVTDPGVQGESYGHLHCLLATGGVLMTLDNANDLQGEATGKHEAA